MKRQIVIEIDDDYYREIMTAKTLGEDLLTLEEAVADGILLPEYHGDLKDVNKIKKEAIDMSQWGSDTAYGVWVEDIDAALTIIPATEEGDGE